MDTSWVDSENEFVTDKICSNRGEVCFGPANIRRRGMPFFIEFSAFDREQLVLTVVNA